MSRSSNSGEDRPVTARSVVASILLPLPRPELSAQALVRCCALFGIADGAARVALSRMVAAGELTAGAGRYRLAGPLLERQRRQVEGLRPALGRWEGTWIVAVATGRRRPAADRAGLRATMARLRLGELRQGVWARPHNLPWLGDDADPTGGGCRWLVGRPGPWRPGGEEDDVALAAALWDLPGWAAEAHRLAGRLEITRPRLEAGDTTVLAEGFTAAAAVVRHLTRDPLLPEALLPDAWPAAALRDRYAGYERAYQRVLADWLATQPW